MCQCLTLKGLQCKNKSMAGSDYCSRHKKCKKAVKKISTKKVVAKKPKAKPKASKTAIKAKVSTVKSQNVEFYRVEYDHGGQSNIATFARKADALKFAKKQNSAK